MTRSRFASLAIAAALCGAAALAAGPVAVVAVLPLALVVLVAPMLSASNPDAHRRTRNLPHWLTVALYRAEAFGIRTRNKLGAAFFAFQVRSGAVLCMAFPGSVTTDLAFGIVGELAADGPMRAQAARISHGTAADIVVGRWFTLAADGTARPGGAGALGGLLMNPKNYVNGGTGGNALAPSMTLVTGTVGEFGYMGQFIVAAPAAVALGNPAKYDTTTGVIGVGAPGAGEAAIPNSRFIRVANAAAGLAVLELTN
jgi:hypothetical protein